MAWPGLAWPGYFPGVLFVSNIFEKELKGLELEEEVVDARFVAGAFPAPDCGVDGA